MRVSWTARKSIQSILKEISPEYSLVFNMGVGMVIALDESEAEKALEILARNGLKASVIGRVVEGEGVTLI